MGLGLTSKTICQRDMFGFIASPDRYFTRTSDVSFDNLTDMTCIAFINSCNNDENQTWMDALSIVYDTTHDTGFALGAVLQNVVPYVAQFGDGDGATTSVVTEDNSNIQHAFGLPVGADSGGHSGSPFSMMVCRFDAGATNDTMVAAIHPNGISFTENNIDVANLGAVGTNTNIRINEGVLTSQAVKNLENDHVIHKVSLWKSSLSDADILKLAGLTGSTIADRASVNANRNFHMATRFQSYSDLSITAPDHEWDFTSSPLGAVTTIADTGNTGGKDLAHSGNPEVGRFIQY